MAFADTAGRELAAELRPFEPEMVVSVATMGIPLAIEVTRHLGLDDYVILHKTPKTHLGDSLAEPVRSITTGPNQTLRLDPARAPALRSRRVAVVDDVISTGASTLAALKLVRRVGAEPVVIGALVTEGSGWRTALGSDARQGPGPRGDTGVPPLGLGAGGGLELTSPEPAARPAVRSPASR